MKLTVSGSQHQQGFALPTILLISIVMLTVLVSSIGAAAGSRVALDSQYYNELASQAAESGIARANECLKKSGYKPQWSTVGSGTALTPATDCTGTGTAYSAYVLDTTAVRTKFIVDAPSGSDIGSNLKVTGTTELLRTSENANGTRDVWRRYDHTTYLRIEPPQTIACPGGFIPVPGNSTFGTSDFCVAKYEAKNVGGGAVSQASGTPFVNIVQADATAAATNTCPGCHLITEAEWLTIAHNVLNVSSNWSNGSVGNGSIYIGHTDGSPANTIAASTDDNDGYYATGNTTGSTQRRTLTLSNGEVIWDLSGNVTEWTSGQKTGGQPGTAAFTTFAWRNWNTMEGTGTVSPNPFPSFGTPAAVAWTSTQGIGQVYSDYDDATLRGFLRGGSYTYGATTPGIFALYLGYAPTSTFTNIGFRIAK
jgi:Tfp pilus assembly protein PilX